MPRGTGAQQIQRAHPPVTVILARRARRSANVANFRGNPGVSFPRQLLRTPRQGVESDLLGGHLG